MIKFYHITNCPMCEMLEEELQERNIAYESIMDESILREKNIIHVPALEVNGKILNLAESLKWVNEND